MNRTDAPVYSVSQVNQYLKRMMDRDGLLAAILVRGELSNYKSYPSGHHYFSLKDEAGALRCVMFRSDAVANTATCSMDSFCRMLWKRSRAVMARSIPARESFPFSVT